MADRADQFFGKLAVENGLASQQQIDDCLQEKDRRGAAGTPVQLGTLMVEMGILTAHQVETLLAKQNKRVLVCPACQKHYTVMGLPANKTIRCKACDEPLKAKGADVLQPGTPAAPTESQIMPAVDQGATMIAPSSPLVSGELSMGDQDTMPAFGASPEDATRVAPPPTGARSAPLTLEGDDPLVGRLLSQKYRVLEKIGQGGMGAVYKARHDKLDRLCAIKVLPGELAQNPELLERFRLEAKATAKLDQKNVVTIHDVDTDGTVEYLAMEYLEGNSLEDLVKAKGKLNVRTALQVIRQAALGLGAAHQHGIVHRDIKPANIMLTKDGVVKVMDFGLARLVEMAGMISQTGQIMGTPHFMSPEQAQGEPVDLRTDVYSLGVTLFYLVTGKTPFSAPTPTAILLKVVQDQPPSASQVDPTIPGAVSKLIERMMAKRQEDRYQDTAELVGTLEAMIMQPSGEMRIPSGVHPRPSQPMSRGAQLAIAGSIAAVLLVLGIVFAMAGSGDPSDEELARQERQEAAAKAHEKLLTLLARQASTLEERERKLRACRKFLEKHPEAKQANKVKELARELQDSVASLRWEKEFEKLRESVAVLQREGKIAEAVKRVAAFLARKPTGSAGGWARQLQIDLEQAAQQPIDKTGFAKLRARVDELERGKQFKKAIQLLTLHLASHPDDAAARKRLDDVKRARQQEIQALTGELRKLRSDGDRRGGRAVLRKLEEMGATEGLEEARKWLAGSGPPPRGDPRLAEKLRNALKLLADERYDRAADALRDLPRMAPRELPDDVRGLVDQLALRLGMAQLAQQRYRLARRTLGPLVRGRATNHTGTALALALALRSKDGAIGRALARTLFDAGLPLGDELLRKLGLVPTFGDAVQLKTGGSYRGAVRERSGRVTIVFWKDGKRRSESFSRMLVEKIEKLSPEQIRLATTQGTLWQKLGLARWYELAGKPAEASRLRRAVAQRLQEVRKAAGMRCDRCPGVEKPAAQDRCRRCQGRGTIRPECPTCDGRGKTGGIAGKKDCPTCKGTGWERCKNGCRKGGKGCRQCEKIGPTGVMPCGDCVAAKLMGGDRNCRICGGAGDVPCRACRGRGCGRCRNRGKVRCMECGKGGRPRPARVKQCNACRGSGKRRPEPCPDCRGEKPKRKRCPHCAGTRVSIDVWTAWALAVAHQAGEDTQTAEAYWSRVVAGAALLDDRWRRWLARRTREVGAKRHADELVQHAGDKR